MGCAGRAPIKPVELLDDRTGITVAALQSPIGFVQSERLAVGKRASFVYFGPVEWDRMGDIRYGLWVHTAVGNDLPLGPIRESAAITVIFDDGELTLVPMDAPPVGREPYPPVAAWGESAYFGATTEDLKRLAASRTLRIDVRAKDGSSIEFRTTDDTHATLAQFLQAQHITDD